LQHSFTTFTGIDPSLTNTGVAMHWPQRDLQQTELFQATSVGKKDDTWGDRGRRILDLAYNVYKEIPTGSLVVIESPSYGSRGGSQHDRAGLWWEIHHQLRRKACVLVSAAPSQRMKYVTGKGRADKDTVLAHTIRRYPDLDITNNNTADAVIFMAMAARLAGHPIENGTHIKAMDEVTEKLANQLEDN